MSRNGGKSNQEGENITPDPNMAENQQKQEKDSASNPKSGELSANVFTFWAYFTAVVSLITVVFIALSFLVQEDDKSWFLSLSPDLRSHFTSGKLIKAQIGSDQQSIQVFVVEDGPRDGETVVLLHGLGCSSYSFRRIIASLALKGFHVIAIDLPGSGFSDKTILVEEEFTPGVFSKVMEVYDKIKEKGLFWGFDQLIETGGLPYVENEIRVYKTLRLKPLGLSSEEVGQIIGQVIDCLGLAPVHVVLHDSALESGAIWVSGNLKLVRSITLIDASETAPSLPIWALKIPLIRELVLGSSTAFSMFVRLCCSRSMEKSVAEAHRVLLKGRDGRRAVVEAGDGLNSSFGFTAWAGSDMMREIPVHILWSRDWSREWTEKGRQVASVFPQAGFVTHSGGRWPQEDVPDEISEAIADFVSSLPKSIREMKEDPIPEHIRKMFDEAKDSSNHHHHGGDFHGHQAGYMDAYGLGHGG
ncbi:protein AUXIN RESPONSE 4 [Amborella trichopoda]|uniref:AB hydrolase-1 domain-containing protein n=1 Tax=Amborella trichopoda TaxID=13333 RepID=W1P1K4_AMBTC|nr:protein AUXIN RESPONSE 4 [Amborella trichopoda]ERN00830.1 hypothetical protein AMTR_s00103p00063820 [Amborella trichopoda]|eukprot:XP_006838261.1 protein AUXIN RESPONSE 4 [Amborella trichopoda]